MVVVIEEKDDDGGGGGTGNIMDEDRPFIVMPSSFTSFRSMLLGSRVDSGEILKVL